MFRSSHFCKSFIVRYFNVISQIYLQLRREKWYIVPDVGNHSPSRCRKEEDPPSPHHSRRPSSFGASHYPVSRAERPISGQASTSQTVLGLRLEPSDMAIAWPGDPYQVAEARKTMSRAPHYDRPSSSMRDGEATGTLPRVVLYLQPFGARPRAPAVPKVTGRRPRTGEAGSCSRTAVKHHNSRRKTAEQ